MLFTSRCQHCPSFSSAFVILLTAHLFRTSMDVCFLCRCGSDSYRLLRVSKDPGLKDTLLPVWPSSLFLLYPTVLQLLQPLLLCVHCHRVSPFLSVPQIILWQCWGFFFQITLNWHESKFSYIRYILAIRASLQSFTLTYSTFVLWVIKAVEHPKKIEYYHI